MKNIQKIYIIPLLTWIFLPIIEIIYYPIKYIFLQQQNYILMPGWNYSCYIKCFDILGMVTLISGFLALIIYIQQNKDHITQKGKKKPWLISLSCLLGWSYVCCICSGNFLSEWYGTGYRVDGMRSYLIYAAIFIFSCLITETKTKRILLETFSFSANAVAIVIILQMFNIEQILNVYPEKGAAIFFNTNHCAYYLTMTIIAIIGLYIYSENKKLKVALVVSLLLQYYALLQNNTFGCYLAVWFATILVYIIKKRICQKFESFDFIPVLIIAILSIINVPLIFNNFVSLFGDVDDIVKDSEAADQAGSGRLILWKYAISVIKQKPIFGVGPEGLVFIKPENITNDRPHNEYLQYAVFLGIPGLILYLFSLISLAVHSLKSLLLLYPEIIIAGGVVFGYCASAFFGNTMFYTTPYFFMMLGFVASRNAKKHL